MSKEVIKLITERKMSDAKDMIDSILKSKLAESIDMFYEKNLDPVGKEDGDIDNDGDEDDTDKYLLNRLKKIGQAIKKEDVDVNEEAYGHQSAHDHKETEAREKKVGTGKVHRAKGGSY